ncbi:MAG: helix-turn-helix transcriptional regulator [Gammaproteobacteria bacterium]|nr:helix-turn-helix transcriptional regulator [Gammaproteobacteria bacterium]MCY4283249.1 helix-turn-helix transcriptional regulator [Gammaproteobacteria bacterium]
MTEPQIIRDSKGNPMFAVIPWRVYHHLRMGSAVEPPTDENLYNEVKSSIDEAFPIEVADSLLAGDCPLKVYRKFRGMTQQELAKSVRVHSVYLSQIETGRRSVAAKTLAAIARVLNVAVEDLRY